MADTPVDSASLAGTAGATSSLVGLVTSFLPKKLPKMEFRFVGLGAVSRAGFAAAGMASLAGIPAVGLVSTVPAVGTPSVGKTGSVTTRLARRY